MHGEAADLSVFIPLLVFLGATSLVIPAFRRLGLSAVVAFLAIGIALGPDVAGRLAERWPALEPLVLEDSATARFLAELGVIFLLFVIGLEVSTERLWALRKLVLGLGAAQVLITAAAVFGIALLFGASVAAATVIGFGFALSSTAVVLQVLGERAQLSGGIGRAGFSVLLMQDLAVVPILFVVAALGAQAGEEPAGPAELLGALALAAATIAIIATIGRLALRPLFRWAASVDSREVFLATALLVAIAAAAAAQAANLSMALGAFLAGVLLAETEFRHGIETDIDPFKGLLLGVFFVSVGAQVDLDLAFAQPLALIGAVLGLALLKAAIVAPLARLFGLGWPAAINLGLLLAQAGEFAFVIFAAALEGGILADAEADFLLLVVSASLMLTPLWASLGERAAKALAARSQAQGDTFGESDEQNGHVIIAGFGRVGRSLGELMRAHRLDYAAIETDAEAVARLRGEGWRAHYGDASRVETLASLGAARAAAIVVTMNDFAAVERVVEAARGAWPHVPIYARARDPDQARTLHLKGAALASPETTEATLQLAEALLNGIGFPDEAARRIVDEKREAEIARTLLGRPPKQR